MEAEKNNIYKRMNLVMDEVGFVSKGNKNTFSGYMFRSIDDMYKAIQPALIKHGVFVSPKVLSYEVKEGKTNKGGVNFHTHLLVEYTFWAIDGTSITATTLGEAIDTSDKSANQAMSAAFKMCLIEIFCVPTEDGDDADSKSPRTAPPEPKTDKPMKMKELPVEEYAKRVIEKVGFTIGDAAGFFLSKGKLESGQTFYDLSEKLMQAIVDDPAKFEAALAEWKKENE